MAYILSVWPSRLESPMQSIEEFDDKTSFFAVYDGQTGGSVPTFCARYLQEEIRRFEIQNITENGEKSDPEFLMLQSAIERAFLGLDDMLRGENYWTQLNEGDISYDNMHDVASLDDAGSMICAVIVRDNRLIIANAGRCRCVISRMHQPFALSKDHTCQEWVERKRVGEAKKALAKAAEGSLSDMNLQNARAPYFTRAIGYMRYKKIYVVRAEHQIVTAKPEVKVVTLKDDIQFIILATRAFWEKVKPEEAVRTANADIVFGISKACRGLQDLYDSKIGKAKANMLIMIIQLPDAVQVQPPGDNIQIEEKPVEFKCRNVVDCVKDPSKWKPFSDKYILARDKDEAELREQIRVATLTSIVYGDDLGPRFRMQSRGDGNEVFQYDDKLKQMCLQRLKNYTARSIDKCKVMSEILAVIEDLFDKDDVESLRGLYYRLDRRYDMDTIYSAVTEICKLLECTRVSLKLCGTPQGSVAGAVLITANGKTFDCEGGGKAGLKTIVEAEELSGITAVVAKPGRTIRYILLLEEEAAFSLLTRRKFEEKQNCVLVSGGGQPDVLTRIMLSKLVQLLHVPAYCMVDCNPSGAGIFCTYKYGSQERAFDNLGLTTSLRLIGLMSQHLPRVKDCCSQLSVRDGTLLKNLLESKHLKEDIPLYEHLVHMKKSGLTAQIESLQTLNGHASVEEYIIEQIELAELQGT